MLSFTPHQYLPLVKAGIKKTPSDEWSGSKAPFYFIYEELDSYFRTGIIDAPGKKLATDRLHVGNFFKHRPMPTFDPDIEVKSSE